MGELQFLSSKSLLSRLAAHTLVLALLLAQLCRAQTVAQTTADSGATRETAATLEQQGKFPEA